MDSFIQNLKNIKLDYLLKSWGLLSGDYKTDGRIEITKWGKFHQIFVIIFWFFALLKLMVAIILEDNSIWVYYFCDVTAVFDYMSPRIYLLLLFILVTVKSLLMFYYFNQSSGKLCWLEITELIKGKFLVFFS